MMLSLILIAFDREWTAWEQHYAKKLTPQRAPLKEETIKRVRQATFQMERVETLSVAQYNKWSAEGERMLLYNKNVNDRCELGDHCALIYYTDGSIGLWAQRHPVTGDLSIEI